MKCLTILQPYAHLICGLAANDPRRKRVENRNHARFKNYRGMLLIHAGKSDGMVWPYLADAINNAQHWSNNYGIPHDQLTFGTIIGAADMVSHFELGKLEVTIGAMIVNGVQIAQPGTRITNIIPVSELRARPWLTTHEHVEGPNCLVFENIRRFREPIPCKGAQGMWNLPAELEAKVKEALESAEVLP